MAVVVWFVLWLVCIGGRFLWRPTLDVQLHNTYLVVGGYAGQLGTFLLTLLLILLLDAGRRWAAKSTPVAVACGFGSTLLLC